MTDTVPSLTQFRIEPQDNGLVHLVFDCPDRSMNVFSNKAIHELGQFADWLRASDVRGVVVRSGKPTGFCAGADLNELGAAYDMIVAAPPYERFDKAFNHFFPLGHAIRRMETSGKPVAAAIAGVALGGGCELAMGCHYRVATSAKHAMLGLPECAVGLLPGAGGTQRITRLVGLELGLDVLLLGRNLQGEEALEAELIDEVVEDGAEVAAAEAWLLSDAAHCTQPWDQADARPIPHSESADLIEATRARELARMLGHEPAPLAILDCVELGFMQYMDGAIRAEMSVFSRLIQRPEPRNMIRTMFMGKQAYDKAKRAGAIDPALESAKASVQQIVEQAVNRTPGLKSAGFLAQDADLKPVRDYAGNGFWFTSDSALLEAAKAISDEAAPIADALNDSQNLLLDHMLAAAGIVPGYLGGLFGLKSACVSA